MKYKKYLPLNSSDFKANLSLKDGSTFLDLLDSLDIPRDDPKLVLINGISRGISDKVHTERLRDGDVVAIFPPAGGG